VEQHVVARALRVCTRRRGVCMSTSRRSCLDSSWYVVVPAVTARDGAPRVPERSALETALNVKNLRIVFLC
jgi:hypothetical protein